MKKPKEEKRGVGRPRLENANTTTVTVALPASDAERLQSVADKKKTSRSELAREIIREGIHSIQAPGEAAKRAAERLQTFRTGLDSLHPEAGPFRDATIQKWLGDGLIRPEEARELAKPARKR